MSKDNDKNDKKTLQNYDDDVLVTKSCPFDAAGLLSRTIYLWVFPLFNLGYSKSLVVQDLYSHPKEDDPWNAVQLLESEWNLQLKNVKEGKQEKPSLITAVRRAFGWKYFLCCQGLFWGEILIRLTQPLMVGKVVRYLSQEANSADNPVSTTTANICGYGIVMTSVIFVVTRQHSFTVAQRIGNNVRSAVTILVYKKLLRLSKSSFEDSDIGKVLNVLANDLNRIDEIARWFSFLISGPVMAVYVIVVSWMNIGVASVGGLSVLLLFIPFNALMGRLFNTYRLVAASLSCIAVYQNVLNVIFSKKRTDATRVTDKRIRLMTEIVSSMKLIKVYCWEEPFANLVKTIRGDEIACLKKSYLLKAINAALSFVTTRLMLFTSFVIYALMGNTMHPEPIFVIMSLFNTIRIPVTKNLPNAVGAGAEALVAMKRVLNILTMEERSDATSGEESKNFSHGSVILKSLTAKWTKKLKQASLQDVSLMIKPQETVIVIGSVGSGKTCLLWSLLSELHVVSGSVSVSGRISYSPQESWCFGGTVKDNIVMGDVFDAQKYRDIIFSCGLEKDMQLFLKEIKLLQEKKVTLYLEVKRQG